MSPSASGRGGGPVGGGPVGGREPLPDYVERVLDVVADIPAGRVLTYGDVASVVGRGGPRGVGQVMSRYGAAVPWWRVVRAGGWPPRGLERRAYGHYAQEGTPLEGGAGVGRPAGDAEGYRIDLASARWVPGDRRPPGAVGGS